jgi:hypothetical protein
VADVGKLGIGGKLERALVLAVWPWCRAGAVGWSVECRREVDTVCSNVNTCHTQQKRPGSGSAERRHGASACACDEQLKESVGLLEAVGCARARVDTSTFVVDRAVDLVRVVTARHAMIILNNIDISKKNCSQSVRDASKPWVGHGCRNRATDGPWDAQPPGWPPRDGRCIQRN